MLLVTILTILNNRGDVFDGLKNLLTQPVLLQQVAKGQDHRLIWDLITGQLDADKAAHGGHLDQDFFHRRVAE
jgi:hypothetical protein